MSFGYLDFAHDGVSVPTDDQIRAELSKDQRVYFRLESAFGGLSEHLTFIGVPEYVKSQILQASNDSEVKVIWNKYLANEVAKMGH